jgi:hypothetical protein
MNNRFHLQNHQVHHYNCWLVVCRSAEGYHLRNELLACGEENADVIEPLQAWPPVEWATKRTRQPRTQLEVVLREIKLPGDPFSSQSVSDKFVELPQTPHCIDGQQRHDKSMLYSIYEPEERCIDEGNAGGRSEFNETVSATVTCGSEWSKSSKRRVKETATGYCPSLAGIIEAVIP